MNGNAYLFISIGRMPASEMKRSGIELQHSGVPYCSASIIQHIMLA